MSNVAVIFQNVHKKYRAIHALKGISFRAYRKEVFGLVGPNGAGKTTALRLVAGIFKPNQGVLLVNGVDTNFGLERVRKMVGYLPEFPYVYERLTVSENLEFFARVYEVRDRKKRKNQLLETLDIKNLEKDKLARLSKGQKQRVSIACTLIHDPDILVLDEPTAGLDPSTAVFIRQFITQLAHEGRTILVSSHNLYELEKICDRLGILNDGVLIVKGTLEALKQKLGSDIIEIRFLTPFLDELKMPIEGVTVLEVRENHIFVRVDKVDVLNQLLTYLMERGVSIGGAMLRKSLEDAYVEYMGDRNG